jgi:hypothetical protein
VQYIFCMNVVPLGIKRSKQHLTGGRMHAYLRKEMHAYLRKAPEEQHLAGPKLVSKEMHAYLRKNTNVVINLDPEEGEERNEDAPQPSFGTK